MRIRDNPSNIIPIYINRYISANKSTKFHLYGNELWEIKKVDKETASNLYNIIWNPFCASIIQSYSVHLVGVKSYDLRCKLWSIDNSSYTIMWINKDLLTLGNIRLDVMKWIDSKKILNGNEFIEYCLSKGADLDSVNYD